MIQDQPSPQSNSQELVQQDTINGRTVDAIYYNAYALNNGASVPAGCTLVICDSGFPRWVPIEQVFLCAQIIALDEMK